jgi:acetyl-CoA C-acetyltransferase
MAETLIIDALRTPIGRFGGGLLEHSAADLATLVTQSLIERSAVPPAKVAEVIFGHVIQGGSNLNVARTAAIRAGLPETVCGSTINMMCASGMRAVEMARAAIALGEGDLFIAGGTESMSNAPFYSREMRWGNKLGSVQMIDAVMDEGLRCPITGMVMGLTAEEIAQRTGISREDQDAWALRSQQRARAAIDAGHFAREIIPVPRRKDEPVTTDEHPRETSLEALAGLRPAFKPDGCVTAGNASGINDGAAALLLASPERAASQGWSPRARIIGSAWAGVAPGVMGLGPVPAVRDLCRRTGIALEEFELIELNEAFAVQALAVMRELGMDEERVNVNGSGIALGHPIGATGARIVVSLLHELERRDAHLGLATLCVGGGMGMAMAIECM